jgi:hypothetical protein
MYHRKTNIYEKVDILKFHIDLFLRTFQQENINSRIFIYSDFRPKQVNLN